MNKHIIYLAGPIDYCSDDECVVWRDELIKNWGNSFGFLNPLDKDLRGKKYQDFEIVEPDKAMIDKADIVLANITRLSHGTPMEIIYAWEREKDVFVVSPGPVSPWVSYHSQEIFQSLGEAMTSLVEKFLTIGSA